MTDPFKKSFFNLPQSIQDVLNLAIDTLRPQEIILFGSRARGDHRPNSDWDIAFKGVSHQKAWPAFLIEQKEEPISLLKYDLVQYEELTPDYHENIQKDGILLYKK